MYSFMRRLNNLTNRTLIIEKDYYWKTNKMSSKDDRKIPAFLKTVYLSNREIRLILAGLYALKMSKEEIEASLWKKLLFEKLHKKTRRKRD